jgi:hypothetical protein
MGEMRYRKPSVKTLLGVTKWKKRAKKALGINKLLAPFRAVNNYQRRMLRRAGYYSPEMKMMRAMKRGQVAGPVGPLQVGEGESGKRSQDDNSLLMAAMLAKGIDGEKKGHKHDDDEGSNVAQAMLLASALKGSPEKHAPKDDHDETPHAPKGRRAARSRAAKDEEEQHGAASDKHANDESKPKRHRGARLFGLFVVAVLTAAAIFTAWFYWFA